MKIANLKVQNFKAFYGDPDEPYEFNFLGKDGQAKNVLLYGENGSGKSSLYWTLHHVLTTTDTTIFKKYKNIFAEKESKPISIEMNFDNGKRFIYDEATGITIDADTQEEFDRLTKIKTFLTYDSIFLINEIFSKEISVERFIYILDVLYGESLRGELQEYLALKDKFTNDYMKDICDLKSLFEEFDNENPINEYWDDIYNNYEYEDIPKIDKETDEAFPNMFETVYYYSDDTIAQLEHIYKTFELLQSDFDIKSSKLDELILSIDEIKETFEEKSESHYDSLIQEGEIFITDFEAIETVDELILLETFFEDIFEIIHDYKRALEVTKNINETLNSKLVSQVVDINAILQKAFKNGIEIEVNELEFLKFNPSNLEKFNPLRYKIKTHTEEIPHRHTKFLNEAKISSVNFAFYISIILSYAELRELKILVLDDLLLSLDMSNREIVLNILHEYFSEYQILFLTHDKAFFELVRRKLLANKLDKKWIEFEMFEDTSSDIPKPLVIPYEGYLRKAESYYKICDYPSAGNYLRKASEEVLDSLLLESFKPSEKSGLDGMIQAYKKMCNEFSINTPKSITYIEELTKRILNPSSHDDLVSPLYKKEIHDAIRLVRILKRLPKIKKTETTIKKGSLLTFKYNEEYEVTYRFLGDVKLYSFRRQILNRDAILLSKCGHKELADGQWAENNQRNNGTLTIKNIFDRNNHFLQTNLGPTAIDTTFFIDNIIIDDSVLSDNIKSLIQKQINI